MIMKFQILVIFTIKIMMMMMLTIMNHQIRVIFQNKMMKMKETTILLILMLL